MTRRKIEIPEGVECPRCGSTDLRGRGTDWRLNPRGDNPFKIKVQLLMCKDCGKIFDDGEVKDNSGGANVSKPRG